MREGKRIAIELQKQIGLGIQINFGHWPYINLGILCFNITIKLYRGPAGYKFYNYWI